MYFHILTYFSDLVRNFEKKKNSNSRKEKISGRKKKDPPNLKSSIITPNSYIDSGETPRCRVINSN